MTDVLVGLARDPARRAAMAAHNRVVPAPGCSWAETTRQAERLYARALGQAAGAPTLLRAAP